ncbi:MAG: hypothetical protein A2277_12820 [Desulfobacterales bacterium RIFOXYA12_FULL_46_15]|nr:MAG: hypothetical protein A2277_12820 [Desulfobacterales bacterium RIFOXYA12_FULL_46_15]
MTEPSFFFHFEVVACILEAMQKKKNEIRLSLDLNLTETLCRIEKDRLILYPSLFIDRETLETISSVKNRIFLFRENALHPLEIRSNAYYKLVPTKTAPILEIDGIKMHRSKEVDPLVDAKEKTRMIVTRDDITLDTCGGLGYSALFAVKAGAGKVVSTEKSHEVIKLRSLNPWLSKMDQDRIDFIHEDVTRYIEGFKDNLFNSVIHDPPRFTSATGDLYGKPFYDALFRVMAPKARLFHYTGSPKKIKTNDRFIMNTISRLEKSRFSAVCFRKDLQGIFARKD